MELGVIFPQTEIGTDPVAIRDFAQAVEGLGYSYLLVFDHVLGADPKHHSGWSGPYTIRDAFHEPFILFGHLAAVTRRLHLVTGIIILPQRQTVLVAKQAAEVDVLSGGRLRLGIGLGWNQVEYEALGEDFHNRGRRCEEQVAVLRALWTQESVDFQGRWHRISGAGLNPMPTQRPIPIWFGGRADAVLRRTVRIGDGWLANMPPGPQAEETVTTLRKYAQEAGRSSSLSIGASVSLARGSVDSLVEEARRWQRLGAAGIHLNTMRAGLASVDDHIKAIRTFKEAADKGLA
ncbi:MAG: LLM class F420-dependent oxidoreductase [Chloroflexi bacterium]|nr:LLM class F420-dependent oxidoreductase [Chloroflexota bacterium]